jgi:phosphatidylglycerol lysyltransferase
MLYSKQRQGVVSWVRRGRYMLVGGGLIAPTPHRRGLLQQSMRKMRRQKQQVAFHNISEENLPLYRELGFQIATAYYADLWPRGTRFDPRKPAPASEYRSQQ